MGGFTSGSYKPGESGNPNGRPINKNSIRQIFLDVLLEERHDKRTNFEMIVRKLVNIVETAEAETDVINSAKYLIDQVVGKATETKEIHTEHEFIIKKPQDQIPEDIQEADYTVIEQETPDDAPGN